MKRIIQLQTLSKEHHQSLRLAKNSKDMASNENIEVVNEFSLQLLEDLKTIWRKHFLIEESTIFSIAKIKTPELLDLCEKLSRDHIKLESMILEISNGSHYLLSDFGILLHDHTRLEERELFPLVESLFSQSELDNIFKISNEISNIEI